MRTFTTIFVCFLLSNSLAHAKPYDYLRFFLGSGKPDDGPDQTTEPANASTVVVEYISDLLNSSSEFAGENSTKELHDESLHNVTENSVMGSIKNSNVTPKVPSSATSMNTKQYAMNGSSTHSSDEVEEVVLGVVTHDGDVVPIPKTFLQKSIDWMEDAYTLSILIPIAAGVLFATTIILVIACCRCVRRCCRRRRFKRKVLPESVKNLRPSDRARLLAGESSDEEF